MNGKDVQEPVVWAEFHQIETVVKSKKEPALLPALIQVGQVGEVLERVPLAPPAWVLRWLVLLKPLLHHFGVFPGHDS